MDIELIQKLDDLIKIFDDSVEIKRIQALKKEIYEDAILKEKLVAFNQIRDDIYDPNYIQLKKEILSFASVSEYKRLENDLYILTLSINQKMHSLISKGCKHEDN